MKTTIILLLAVAIFCLATRQAGVWLANGTTFGVWSEIGGHQSWSITIKDRVVFVHVDFRRGHEDGHLWVLL